MNTYFDQLCAAMAMVSAQPNAIVLGQGVAYSSTNMSPTFRDVPREKMIEMPVAEELQTSMALGMALGGFLPVSCYPRWSFLLRAADAIVNHLDRLPIYSAGGYKPRVIIRVAIPSTEPFAPQSQHDDDFTVAFRYMLRTIPVKRLERAEDIVPAYREAMAFDGSTILVEYAHLYRGAGR